VVFLAKKIIFYIFIALIVITYFVPSIYYAYVNYSVLNVVRASLKEIASVRNKSFNSRENYILKVLEKENKLVSFIDKNKNNVQDKNDMLVNILDISKINSSVIIDSNFNNFKKINFKRDYEKGSFDLFFRHSYDIKHDNEKRIYMIRINKKDFSINVLNTKKVLKNNEIEFKKFL
jgi:hypothetical protein